MHYAIAEWTECLYLNEAMKDIRSITNMVFWESSRWKERVESIYSGHRHPAGGGYPAWREALLLFSRRRGADIVIIEGSRTCLIYGLLCLLTCTRSLLIMTEVFIDDGGERTVAGRLKYALLHMIAIRSLGILTNSSSEIDSMSERLKIPAIRLRYVPLHSNIHHPSHMPSNDGYILAAGRSGRDYRLLLEAVQTLPVRTVIICDPGDMAGIPRPPNVELLHHVPYERYLEYLRGAAVAAVPLNSTQRSTGQVAMLEAMGLGKPVVATDAPGTRDHIKNGVNGFLVPPGDAGCFRKRLRALLESPSLCASMGQEAVKHIQESCTFDQHARKKLEAIESLYQQAGGR